MYSEVEYHGLDHGLHNIFNFVRHSQIAFPTGYINLYFSDPNYYFIF